MRTFRASYYNQYDFLYNYRIIMFIRVVLLININTNNSYITTLQELSVCVFIETISVCVKTHYIPAPSISVNINLSQDYTRVEVSLIETPFPWQTHLYLYINPPYTLTIHNPHSHPLQPPPPHLWSKLPARKNYHSDCNLELASTDGKFYFFISSNPFIQFIP